MRHSQSMVKLLNVQVFLNKKAKAFTLIELTVTMLISGFVILAAFQVINNFSSLNTRMGRNNARYTQMHQFHKAINNDMQQALKIQHYDDETIFHLPDEISVSYQWEDDCLVRAVDEVTDSFFIQLKDWHMVKDKNTGLPIVLELEIDNEEHETELYRIVKQYNNDELFNRTELRD